MEGENRLVYLNITALNGAQLNLMDLQVDHALRDHNDERNKSNLSSRMSFGGTKHGWVVLGIKSTLSSHVGDCMIDCHLA